MRVKFDKIDFGKKDPKICIVITDIFGTSEGSPDDRHIRTVNPDARRAHFAAGSETLCGASTSHRDFHNNVKPWEFRPCAVAHGVDAQPCEVCRHIKYPCS